MLVRPTVKAIVPQVIGPVGTGLPWESGGGGDSGAAANVRITEDAADVRITEDGETRITEN